MERPDPTQRATTTLPSGGPGEHRARHVAFALAASGGAASGGDTALRTELRPTSAHHPIHTSSPEAMPSASLRTRRRSAALHTARRLRALSARRLR